MRAAILTKNMTRKTKCTQKTNQGNVTEVNIAAVRIVSVCFRQNPQFLPLILVHSVVLPTCHTIIPDLFIFPRLFQTELFMYSRAKKRRQLVYLGQREELSQSTALVHDLLTGRRISLFILHDFHVWMTNTCRSRRQPHHFPSITPVLHGSPRNRNPITLN